MCAGGAEARCPPRGVTQGLEFAQLRVEDLLANKLRNTVATVDCKVLVGVVEEHHCQIATIVFIHDASWKIKKYGFGGVHVQR